jgi:hypothetical protein
MSSPDPRSSSSTTIMRPKRQDKHSIPSERAREAREIAERVFTPEQQTGLHTKPNRAERRKAGRPMPGSEKAWFCSALDGKVHVVQASPAGGAKRTTVCGRHAQLLPPGISVKKNRCAACARVLA